ncbi:hypothetical protein [Myxosarcina sp. GI1(2024)]
MKNLEILKKLIEECFRGEREFKDTFDDYHNPVTLINWVSPYVGSSKAEDIQRYFDLDEYDYNFLFNPKYDIGEVAHNYETMTGIELDI